MESLVEKLCLRFRVTKTERQWRDLAFCLSMFNYNDKGKFAKLYFKFIEIIFRDSMSFITNYNYFYTAIKKLNDNFASYSDKLHEDYVYEALNTIITQAKKGIEDYFSI